jgi:methyl-accepting chemotaxis protein WspA
MSPPRILQALWPRARISSHLLFYFLCISLIPCGLLTALTLFISGGSLEKSVRQTLVAISDAKSKQLETFIRERRNDMVVLGRSPSVMEAIQRLAELRRRERPDSSALAQAAQRARQVLDSFAETYGYQNALLFDTDGNTLLRLAPDPDPGANLLTGPLRDSKLAEVFDRVRTLLQVDMSDYQLYPGRSEPVTFVAGPVYEPGGRIGGYLALELGNQEIFQALTDYSGLGETGEAMVAMREGQRFAFIAAPRHDPNATFHFEGEMGSDKSTGMQLALQGRRGYGTEVDYRGARTIAVWSYLHSYRWGMVVKQDVEEAFALTRRQSAVVAALLAATAAIVTTVALLVARTIARPIGEAALVAERIAAGDLTATTDAKAPGEAGLLLQAIRKMIEDLRSLIARIQRSSIALLSTATEIAATSRQQEQAVYDYSASTNEAAAAVNEISATSQELLKTMNEVNQVANQATRMASTGQKALSGMDQTMRQLAESTDSIGSKLSVISERAANINLVVTTITKVADQTNLLSINAAIEAEKAGEYGLGFLVVAREIRRLADQTAVATLDIERMVKEMQYSVSAGVMEMDKFSEQVRQVVGEVGQLGGQLGQIISGVQALHQRFDQVTEGMRVQSQGADQIREAMTRLSEAAGQTSTSIREFNKATDRLREAVGGLKDEVSRFTLGPASPSSESLSP